MPAPKLTHEQAIKLVEDYQKGTEIIDLCAEYRLTQNSVISRLKTAGAYKGKSRPPIKQRKKRSVKVAPPAAPAPASSPPKHEPKVPECNRCYDHPVRRNHPNRCRPVKHGGKVLYMICEECQAEDDARPPGQ